MNMVKVHDEPGKNTFFRILGHTITHIIFLEFLYKFQNFSKLLYNFIFFKKFLKFYIQMKMLFRNAKESLHFFLCICEFSKIF